MYEGRGLLKRLAVTGAMLLFLTVLMLGVMRLPQLYGDYSDRYTLNRPEYTENEVKVYARDYISMEEKLQEIAYYQSRSIELQPVYLPAAGDMEVSSETLTGYLQEELDQLFERDILHIPLNLSEYNLTFRELCNLYPGNGDRLRGRIDYWILTYEGEEGQLIAQMDTEYHKLYSVNLQGYIASWECYALGEVLSRGIKNKNGAGTEMARSFLESLSEGYAAYYGIVGGEEREETVSRQNSAALAWSEDAKNDMVRYLAPFMDKAAQDLYDEGWGFTAKDTIPMKDGAGLGIWGNYQAVDRSCTVGIRWGV